MIPSFYVLPSWGGLERDVFCFFSSVCWQATGCMFHELPYVHIAFIFIRTPSQTGCGRKSGPGSDGLWAETPLKPDLLLHVDREQHCDDTWLLVEHWQYLIFHKKEVIYY